MAERYLFNSTNVVEGRYDAEKQRLTIEFVRNRKYRYKKVPPEVWEEFKKAASPGSFVMTELNGKYEHQEV